MSLQNPANLPVAFDSGQGSLSNRVVAAVVFIIYSGDMIVCSRDRTIDMKAIAPRPLITLYIV